MDNVEPREVTVGGGTLILRTKYAQDLFEQLSSNGNFWEYISTLLDEPRQPSVGMDQLIEMVKSLNDKITTAGTQSLPTLLDSHVSVTKKEEVPIKKLEPLANTNLDVVSLLASFKNM